MLFAKQKRISPTKLTRLHSLQRSHQSIHTTSSTSRGLVQSRTRYATNLIFNFFFLLFNVFQRKNGQVCLLTPTVLLNTPVRMARWFRQKRDRPANHHRRDWHDHEGARKPQGPRCLPCYHRRVSVGPHLTARRAGKQDRLAQKTQTKRLLTIV